MFYLFFFFFLKQNEVFKQVKVFSEVLRDESWGLFSQRPVDNCMSSTGDWREWHNICENSNIRKQSHSTESGSPAVR